MSWPDPFQCGTTCTALQALVHELQHNMYLGHAAGYTETGAFDE